MANKRKKSKTGVSIAIEKELKDKWQEEANALGLTLTEYIIKKCSENYTNEKKSKN